MYTAREVTKDHLFSIDRLTIFVLLRLLEATNGPTLDAERWRTFELIDPLPEGHGDDNSLEQIQ